VEEEEEEEGGGEERTVASPRAVPCWVVSSAGFSRASKQDLSLFTIRARTITFRGVSRFPPPQFSTGRYSIARPLLRRQVGFDSSGFDSIGRAEADDPRFHSVLAALLRFYLKRMSLAMHDYRWHGAEYTGSTDARI